MRLAAPLGLAAAALAVPLLAWYVLRSRRPRIVVASTLLWRGSERPVAAAVPWQRFRPDRTFWLVLAAVLLGALAFARPAVPVEAALGDHTILVIDASGSMLADEGGTSRLDLARRAASDLAAGLGGSQTASVVEAGATASVVGSELADAAAVRRALTSVRPGQGAADLSDAFTLAAALEEPGQRTVTHLFTDGRLPEIHRAAAPPGLLVHAVGDDRPNLAVSRLEAVTTGGGSAQVFVQVRNFGTAPAEARVSVAVDGRDITIRRVALPPRAAESLVLTVPVGAGTSVVEGRVEPVGRTPGGGPASDALWLDDVARATVAGPRQVRALVVGRPSAYLLAALSSIEGVDVRTAVQVPDDLSGTDLLVIERSDAGVGVPPVPTIYVAPTRPPLGVASAPAADRPAVTYQAPDHPLLADVALAGIAIAAAQPVSAPALQPIVSSPDGALVLAGRLEGTPVAYLTFDLAESNLPLHVAWPVFVANAVTWLTAPPALAPLEVGQEAVFTLPAGVEGVEVVDPAGGVHRLDALRPRLVVDRIGLWQAAWTGQDDAVAAARPPPPLPVNAPASESDLARPHPLPGEDATGDPRRDPEQLEATRGERTFGRELLAGALLLLLADAGLRLRRTGRPRRSRGVAR